MRARTYARSLSLLAFASATAAHAQPAPEVEPAFDVAPRAAPEPEPPEPEPPKPKPEPPPPSAPPPAPDASEPEVPAQPDGAPKEPDEQPAPSTSAPPPPCPPPLPAPAGAAPVDTQVVDPTQANLQADWIQLGTGEWLQGTIQRMREGNLDFASASLGNQTVAWASVVAMRSPRRLLFVGPGRTTAAGPSHLADGRLVVQTDDGPRVMDKDAVLSIVPVKDSELNRWAFLATLGLAGRSGNTDTVNYTAFSRLTRVDAFHRLLLEYTGAFGLATGVPNTHKHRGTTAWDLFVSQTFYVTPLSAEAVFDQFQNLGLRWTVASGFGARALRVASLTLKTELASGFLQNNYASVEAGEPRRTQGAFVRPGLQLNGAITSSFQFELQWQSSIVFTNLDYTFHHAAARLSFALFGKATADFMTVFDRQETTVTGADGVTPKRDDISLSLGFGIDLH